MNLPKRSFLEKILSIVSRTIIILFTLLCIYPFYYVIINSISDPTAVAKGVYWVPVNPTFATYMGIFRKGDLPASFLISASRTVLSTFLCVMLTSLFAYLMTKKEMILRKVVYRFAIFTMYINAGLIPWYLVMKAYGLRNNYFVYIVPGMINIFFMILVKTYIEQLPSSLEESAEIDGAGFFTVFYKIILPLSKPIVATISVYCAVGQWNTWMDNYFLVSDPKLQTVQMILYNYLNSAETLAKTMRTSPSSTAAILATGITPQSVQMAIIVVSVIPIMLVYPFLQKHFAKGIMMGAIRG